MMSAKTIIVFVTILTYGYGNAVDQNASFTKNQDNLEFINIPENRIDDPSTGESFQFSPMNMTTNDCAYSMIENGSTYWMVLMFGCAIGSLVTGIIAGLIILQMRMNELILRQTNEDTVMNLIEWNELRSRLRRRMSENEMENELDGNESETENHSLTHLTPLETIQENKVENHEQNIERLI